MRRPEPRMQAWMPVREMQVTLRQYGSATIYRSEELAEKMRPMNGERAVRVTIIVHMPRVKPKKRKQPLSSGAIAVRDRARRKREAADGND